MTIYFVVKSLLNAPVKEELKSANILAKIISMDIYNGSLVFLTHDVDTDTWPKVTLSQHPAVCHVITNNTPLQDIDINR